MMEGENIVQYFKGVKEDVNAIRGENGTIEDEIMIRKVLRNLLPIYSIRVSTIEEPRCTPCKKFTLEGVVSRLISFEMPKFDNYTPTTIGSSSKSQVILSKKKGKYVKSESDIFDDEIDELEALLGKIFGR